MIGAESHRDVLRVQPPVMFTDGTAVFDRFRRDYIVHNKGYFIVAPSGTGKTRFVQAQQPGQKHFIDGDDLWIAAGAQPDTDWWNGDRSSIDAVDQRSDIITRQAMKMGLWVIGACHYYVVPDAIVLPPWDVHEGYVRQRREGNYDGPTAQNMDDILVHRTSLKHIARTEEVPVFPSIDDAVTYINEIYNAEEK